MRVSSPVSQSNKFADVLTEDSMIGFKALAELGIVIQEPQDDEEPIILTKVLHSKYFHKRAAAANIVIDRPEGMEDAKTDDKESSDIEVPVAKKSKARRTEDGDDEDNAGRGKGSKRRRRQDGDRIEEDDAGRGKGLKRRHKSGGDESAGEGDGSEAEAEIKAHEKKSGGKTAMKRKREIDSEQVDGSKGSKVKKMKTMKGKEKEDAKAQGHENKSRLRQRAVRSRK